MNKKEKARINREKKKILKQLYINGCSKCGSHKELVYHHVIPKDKLYSITRVMHMSNETFINELNKCMLLCNRCHNRLGHETIKRYRYE